MFFKNLRCLLIVQSLVCFCSSAVFSLDQQFQNLINLDRMCTDTLFKITLPSSKVIVSSTDGDGTVKISGDLTEFNGALLCFAKLFKKTNRITPNLKLEPVLLYYTFEVDIASTTICQHIVDLTSLYMVPFLIYEGIIDQTKYNGALKSRLQLIEGLCDTYASSLPTDTSLLRKLHSSIYRNLMLPFINSPIEIVEGSSRFRRGDQGGIYTFTECSRNIRGKLGRLVKAGNASATWGSKIRNFPTLTDLRRFLLATCFCDISFMKGINSGVYPKNILIIHQNFFEDSYIAEHANSKHLTQDADSNGDFASFFDFDSDLPTQDEARRKELERRARIVAESMYKWVLDPDLAQICVEPSGEEFRVFLKVTDLSRTPDIRQLVYSSRSGKTTNLSQTVLFPIKSLLGTYTLSKSAFPCEDGLSATAALLPIPDIASQKKTLFTKLDEIQKTAGMTSEQRELFKQLNIDDISWIIGKEIDVNPTCHGVSFSEPYLIEEIWFINKGSVNVTSLF